MDCIARPYFICAQYIVNINSMCIPLSLVATIYSDYELKTVYMYENFFDKEKIFYVITQQSRYNLYERGR